MNNKNVTFKQRSLLLSHYQDVATCSPPQKRDKAQWDLIAKLLNEFPGPKLTAFEWWKEYEYYCQNNPDKIRHIGTDTYAIHLMADESISTLQSKLNHIPGITTEKLKTLARLINDFTVSNIDSIRNTIKRKLTTLILANDVADQIFPACRMTLEDWLFYDTILVHEHFNLIQMTNTTETDHPALIDLFHLVRKHLIEYTSEDKLAEAWATLTLEYNQKNRTVTPMLLQRRWYQLKKSCRERFYNLSCLQGQSVTCMKLIQKIKPTSLQLEILNEYKKIILQPLPSWEDLIKNKLVILREEFESIAMKKRSEIATQPITVPTPTIDLTSTNKKDSDNLGEFQTVLLPEENVSLYYDENSDNDIEASEDTELNKDIPMNLENDNNTTLSHINDDVVLIDTGHRDVTNVVNDNNENEMDVDSNITSNEISIFPPNIDEPVLPQITNVFGNVVVPVETLAKVLASKMTNNVVNPQSNGNGSFSIEEPVRIDETTVNNLIKEQDIKQEKKTNEDFTTDEKLFMIPVVKTVKIDDMGVLPIKSLTHVKNKLIIETIHSKSIVKKTDSKLKCKKNETSSSRSHITKIRSRHYNPSQLSKNPDFNIKLKKLSRKFFASSRNRMLLRACKPLCVQFEKSFEVKLVDGRMYLKPATKTNEIQQNLLESPKSAGIVTLPSPAKDNVCPDTIVTSNNPTNALGRTCVGFLPSPAKDNVFPDAIATSNNAADALGPTCVVFLPSPAKDNVCPDAIITSNNSADALGHTCVDFLPSPAKDNVCPNAMVTSNNAANALGRTGVDFLPSPAKDNLCSDAMVTSNNAANALGRTGIDFLPSPAKDNVCSDAIVTSNNAANTLGRTCVDNVIKTPITPGTCSKKPTNTQVQNQLKFPLANAIVNGKSSISESDLPHQTQIGKLNGKIPTICQNIIMPLINHTLADPKSSKKINHDLCIINKLFKLLEEHGKETPNNFQEAKADNKIKYRRKKYCCWAKTKLVSLMAKGNKIQKHPCGYQVCRCCCRQQLADFCYKIPITRSPDEDTTINKDTCTKPVNKISLKPKNNIEEKVKNLRNTLADIAKKNIHQHIDRFLRLGKNKILLTSIKVPKNLKMFKDFEKYLNKTFDISGVIKSVPPNGVVVVKNVIKDYVSKKEFKEIEDLVTTYNYLNSSINAETNNTSESAKTSNIEDKIDEKKLQACLGPLLAKTLTPVNLLSELKYAHEQNALFFKLNLANGSLKNIAVRLKESFPDLDALSEVSKLNMSDRKDIQTSCASTSIRTQSPVPVTLPFQLTSPISLSPSVSEVSNETIQTIIPDSIAHNTNLTNDVENNSEALLRVSPSS